MFIFKRAMCDFLSNRNSRLQLFLMRHDNELIKSLSASARKKLYFPAADQGIKRRERIEMKLYSHSTLTYRNVD